MSGDRVEKNSSVIVLFGDGFVNFSTQQYYFIINKIVVIRFTHLAFSIAANRRANSLGVLTSSHMGKNPYPEGKRICQVVFSKGNANYD
jgi:hypothetical protein